ncbi:MAG: Gfo/Idh/MocA family oxidoreductase [Clostridia bacterium]
MLKIGVVGCGKITEVRHAPEYAENPAAVVTAWYDAFPEKASAMAEKFGGKAFDSVEALLNSGVDAVSVCVANNAHADVTVQALEAGCHVLCEKPMATTLADCERMTAAAQKAGKRLLLGHNQRFALAHVEARKMIAAGEIGRVLTFHTMFGHPGPEGWTGEKNSWFFDKSRAVLGTLADLGIHKTDLIHFLIGQPITQVCAMLSTADKTYPDGKPVDVDDNALCLYATDQGVTGQMHVSWTNYGAENNSTQIYGTKGVLRLYDDAEYSLILERRDGSIEKRQLDEMTSNKQQTSGQRTNTGVIDEFIRAILSGEPSVIDAQEALKAMRVIFAAEASAKSGRVIAVKQS